MAVAVTVRSHGKLCRWLRRVAEDRGERMEYERSRDMLGDV